MIKVLKCEFIVVNYIVTYNSTVIIDFRQNVIYLWKIEDHTDLFSTDLWGRGVGIIYITFKTRNATCFCMTRSVSDKQAGIQMYISFE